MQLVEQTASVDTLVAALAEAGIALHRDEDDRLIPSVPKAAIPPELADGIRAHRADLLALLAPAAWNERQALGCHQAMIAQALQGWMGATQAQQDACTALFAAYDAAWDRQDPACIALLARQVDMLAALWASDAYSELAPGEADRAPTLAAAMDADEALPPSPQLALGAP